MTKPLYTHAQLRILNAVLEEGSYTAAAKYLDMSQSAISQAIRKLETNLHIQLFILKGKHLVPTDFCIELGMITSRMQELEYSLNTVLQRGIDLDTGVLKIGLCNAMPGMKLIKNFNLSFPNVALEIYFGNYAETFDRVLEKEVDIGILANVPDDTRLKMQPCATQKLVMLASASHPIAKKRSINLNELSQYTIIFRTSGSATQKIIDNVLAEHDIIITPSITLNTQQSVYDAVYQGLGIGFAWSESASRHEGFVKIPIAELDVTYTEVVFALHNNSNRIAEAFFGCIHH